MRATPTPSELDEMNEPLYDLDKWKRPEQWLRWKLVPIYLAVLIVIACVVLLTVFGSVIVGLIAPAAFWPRTKAASSGWLIPVAIFFVLSFPPASAFKHCCHARAEKLEKKRPYYACLARVVREGGFKTALIARYSALPAHFLIFNGGGKGKDAHQVEFILSDILAVFMVLVTFVALWYLNRQLKRVKPQVMLERRRARRLAQLHPMGYSGEEVAPMSIREPELARLSS
ncbi:hypothetical protein AURDEDRAFT_161712 [Auricularia subglabra TFB-10046 SS5]|nr:hypothetical protein AURDEDRAFT_161712 [Auricularia subglabra TFB-10046 SS5]